MNGSADRFVAAVGTQGAPWRSVDVRTLAVKIGRRWTQLVTRGYLDHRPPSRVERIPPVERGSLMAWQFVRPVEEVGGIARGFEAGCIRVRPRSLWVLGKGAQERHELHYYFNDLVAGYRTARYDSWSGHSLVGYGPGVWQLVQAAGLDPGELDNIIRAGSNPYDGYSGLVQFFHGRPEGLSPQQSSSVFELIAPLAVRFDVERTATSGKAVRFGVLAASRDYVRIANCRWTVVGEGPIPRHGVSPLSRRKWKDAGAELHSTVSVPLLPGDRLVTAFLVHVDRCLDRVSASVGHGAPNRRIAAHKAADTDLTRFHRHLFPRDWEGSREFEQAVAILLHFFGFQVDALYSQKGAGEAPDQVAHDPISDVVVSVECTVGPLKTGKLEKLVARAEALRQHVEGATVLPVVACARPRAELSKTELDKAAADGVIVLSRDDLESLWIRVERGAGTSAFIGHLQGRAAEEKRRREEAPRFGDPHSR
jgi:hypothetical protein